MSLPGQICSVGALVLALVSCGPERGDLARETPTAVGNATPTGGSGVPPPLNPVESRVVNAFASLGFDAEQAELSPIWAASIWAQLETGEVFASGSSRSVEPLGDFRSTGNERMIEGIGVQSIVRGAGDTTSEWFVCGDVYFEVHGATPPAYDDFDEFLAAFIVALRC